MKRKVAILAAAVLTVSTVLTGCSSNNASNDYVTVGGYKGVEVDDIDEPEVTDEDVEQYITSLRTQYGTMEEITDRAVEDGDTANIDFVGTMDGEEFDGGSAEGYNLEIGSGSFIDGFEDSIIGHNCGDTFDWNGQFPEDYNNTELAGKAVTFTITVNHIQGEMITPELDEDFVKTVSEESETVEEYKKEIKEQLLESKTEDYEAQLQEAAWAAVFEKAEVKKYPDGDVEEIEKEIKEQYVAAAESYEMELEEFLSQYYGMTEEEFDEQVTLAAESSVKQKLVAEAIAEKENLMPTDKELEEAYEELAEEYGYEDVDALKEVADEDTLKVIVITNRVAEFLGKHAIQVKSSVTTEETDTEE